MALGIFEISVFLCKIGKRVYPFINGRKFNIFSFRLAIKLDNGTYNLSL